MKAMYRLQLSLTNYLIAEKIYIGALSPLAGFMSETDFCHVATHRTLSNGTFFPYPLSLPVSSDDHAALAVGTEAQLFVNESSVGSIQVHDRFTIDPARCAAPIFGTSDPNHPGVDRFLNLGGNFLGGTIQLREDSPLFLSHGERPPSFHRDELADAAVRNVVGFATRNVPHQGHRYILETAADWADIVFVLATIGQPLPGGYHPATIRRGFEYLQQNTPFGHKLRFDFVSMPSFLAGPNDALLQALIRRNYGCTHFIVGRDHSGVGEHYARYASQQCALAYQTALKLEIVAQQGPFYCNVCRAVRTEDTCGHHTEEQHVLEISSSVIKRMQQRNIPVDPILMDPLLDQYLRRGTSPLFLDEAV